MLSLFFVDSNHVLFQKFFRKKPVRDLLPTKPAMLKVLEPWWIVQIGYVTEDDIRVRGKGRRKWVLERI